MQHDGFGRYGKGMVTERWWNSFCIVAKRWRQRLKLNYQFKYSASSLNVMHQFLKQSFNKFLKRSWKKFLTLKIKLPQVGSKMDKKYFAVMTSSPNILGNLNKGKFWALYLEEIWHIVRKNPFSILIICKTLNWSPF